MTSLFIFPLFCSLRDESLHGGSGDSIFHSCLTGACRKWRCLAPFMLLANNHVHMSIAIRTLASSSYIQEYHLPILKAGICPPKNILGNYVDKTNPQHLSLFIIRIVHLNK